MCSDLVEVEAAVVVGSGVEGVTDQLGVDGVDGWRAVEEIGGDGRAGGVAALFGWRELCCGVVGGPGGAEAFVAGEEFPKLLGEGSSSEVLLGDAAAAGVLK